ncbi:MAG: YHS domain-containing protein [Deltaproteobacteria bacterium]|nr:YHS domain-containing protein [Deltaproteobacteria bacterium]
MRISEDKYVDPVCYMVVNPQESDIWLDFEGERYFFCAESCREKFQADPAQYIKPKSWWDRFLAKHIKANEEEFGPQGPECLNKLMGPPGEKC